jgi:hypothetical protein
MMKKKPQGIIIYGKINDNGRLIVKDIESQVCIPYGASRAGILYSIFYGPMYGAIIAFKSLVL